jgi:RNA polymerase sigma-70 factor (ECF subfamily)
MTDATRPPDPAEDDRALIAGYLAGGEGEFRLVDGWVMREIDARYASLAADREDLGQQVHEKLLGNLRAGRFRHGSRLRTYVTSVVHHTCIDALRRRYLYRFEEMADDRPAAWGNPYGAIEARDRERLVHRLLRLSPAVCRRLWRMIFLEERPYRDIARLLGIPAGTVKSRVFACRRKALAIWKRLVESAAH